MIVIEPGDPRHPDALALLRASHAMMTDLFDPGENHFLSVDQLCAPDIRFFTARDGTRTVGCAALALRDGYGEVKSMFVAPDARGSGAANALMRMLEDSARAEGLAMLRLETGDALVAARRLYAKAGFSECGPFGAYEANSTSIFMEKPLG